MRSKKYIKNLILKFRHYSELVREMNAEERNSLGGFFMTKKIKTIFLELKKLKRTGEL